MIPKNAKQYFTVETNINTKTKGKLKNYTVSVKDCICVKNIETTSSSKILKGYKPVFNATVVNKVLNEGATIIGKTIQDEFGFGTFCTNTGIGYENPTNPLDKNRVTGGSSGGSAGATNVIENHISIAESTGGSIANPASFCNIVGITPTYGLVSRYGLIDYANSLDKIGIMAKTVKQAKLGLEIIKGYDEKDSTSIKKDVSLDCDKNTLKIGIPKQYVKNINSKIKKSFDETIQKLKAQGHKIKTVSLSLNEQYSIPTYYIIAMSEASTNLAKLCGLRYGISEDKNKEFNDYFKAIRSKNFGIEAKRRILLGTFARMAGYRDAYYEKALKVRTKLIQEYKDVFENVDVLAHPTMPIFPPKFEEVKKLTPLQTYQMDLQTVGANLAGLPHISIPLNTKLPSGLMFTANHFEENKLFKIGEDVEK